MTATPMNAISANRIASTRLLFTMGIASFAVIATQDRMINPDLERFMAKRAKAETIELPGSHAIFLSHPKEVAALIEKAAKAAQ